MSIVQVLKCSQVSILLNHTAALIISPWCFCNDESFLRDERLSFLHGSFHVLLYIQTSVTPTNAQLYKLCILPDT